MHYGYQKVTQDVYQVDIEEVLVPFFQPIGPEVDVGQVRDFRGAMVGRADKGLLITTGNFTKEAMREATRDEAPAIYLIDGDLLLDTLKELGLGVKTEKIEVEKVTIDQDWLLSI